MAGRFAPSPTGDLHLGNLRTAALAWLSARSQGLEFIVRMEDLDRHQSSRDHELGQLRDLAAIGVDWDGPVVRQSERFDLYEQAITELSDRGLVYECYCTRREIQQEIAAASQAPHGPPGSYPGTCRDLTAGQRARRRAEGRPPALRLRSDGRTIEFVDRVVGPVRGVVDDVVLRRNDGVPAYNLAVVVDDADQEVTEVVRGDDLVSSTPRQIRLQELLGLPRPQYAHVPLVVDAAGERLAKRAGMAVTLHDLGANGVNIAETIRWISASVGTETTTLRELASRFDIATVDPIPSPAPSWAVRTV
jgi:glutamyl-tRNA synthetase